ncbi:MAG: diversity-generating retroelement protein Avd [Candidatus Brocadiales bacterium]|nr:diversity-generating retroelement protein Avd [Candidatus Brocadiales bacterium]
MENQIPLYLHWNKTIKYILNKTEKFPKRVRFTFSSRIDNIAIDILERIVEAQYSQNRLPFLKNINLNLEKLRVFCGLTHDLGYLDHKGYEHLSRLIDEAGRMTGGWQKQMVLKHQVQ